MALAATALQLSDEVLALEAERSCLRDDAEYWRLRCVQLGHECANFALREDVAQTQLKEAHVREREMAKKTIERQLACSELAPRPDAVDCDEVIHLRVELLDARAQCQALREQIRELRGPNSARYAALESECKTLRTQMLESQTLSSTLQSRIDRLEKDAIALESDRDAQTRARGLAEQQVADLQWQVAQLRDAAADQRKHTSSLEEANQHLRMDLQEAVSQSLKASKVLNYQDRPRSAGLATPRQLYRDYLSEAATTAPNSPGSPSPSYLSPRSRLDYPRSARARQLRKEILQAKLGV